MMITAKGRMTVMIYSKIISFINCLLFFTIVLASAVLDHRHNDIKKKKERKNTKALPKNLPAWNYVAVSTKTFEGRKARVTRGLPLSLRQVPCLDGEVLDQ